MVWLNDVKSPFTNYSINHSKFTLIDSIECYHYLLCSTVIYYVISKFCFPLDLKYCIVLLFNFGRLSFEYTTQNHHERDM